MSDKIEKAVAFATEAHKGQTRKDGKTPYISHPIAVMKILQHEGFTDEDMLAAAVLHDVLEDTATLAMDLTVAFGERVSRLVVELTNRFKKEHHPTLNRRERKLLEHDRISRISTDAKIVKTADRLHNLLDLTHMKLSFVKLYIDESQDLLRALWGDGDAPAAPREIEAHPEGEKIKSLVGKIIETGVRVTADYNRRVEEEDD